MDNLFDKLETAKTYRGIIASCEEKRRILTAIGASPLRFLVVEQVLRDKRRKLMALEEEISRTKL
jgi:hypothetical protein